MKIFDIDQLSRIVNETLDKRKNQIPHAEEIIEENIGEYKEWKKRRSEYLSQGMATRITTGNTEREYE